MITILSLLKFSLLLFIYWLLLFCSELLHSPFPVSSFLSFILFFCTTCYFILFLLYPLSLCECVWMRRAECVSEDSMCANKMMKGTWETLLQMHTHSSTHTQVCIFLCASVCVNEDSQRDQNIEKQNRNKKNVQRDGLNMNSWARIYFNPDDCALACI